MKTIFCALASMILLAGPAVAGHSTKQEREATRQLNLEAARQAQNTNQQIAANVGQNTQTQTQAESAPAAAPTTSVESAPAASPTQKADQSQSQDANPQPASPAQ